MRLRKRKTIGTRLHRLYFFLWDGMYDRLDTEGPDWPYGLLDAAVERPGKWVLCKIYGHEAERDQCGIPEHDFCVWCGRSMPEMAVR